MRFVSTIVFLVAFCAITTAVIAQSVDLSEPASRTFTPRLHKGKQASSLKPRDGFLLETVENGLGNISSLSVREDGTIFTTDAETGRIWQLSDRNKDGRVDIKRALPHRFDRPTGLAVTNKQLYIADRAAIWVIKDGQPPEKIAGLINANSTDAFHPLALSADSKSLFLGLTTKDGITNILSVNRKTGQAHLIDSLPRSEQLRAIAALNNTTVWSVTENGVGAALSQLTKIDESHRLAGLALPSDTQSWSPAYSQHAIVSKHSADGYAILALPAALGNVRKDGDILLFGFLTTSGRSAWGRPGALSFDDHGLLIADDFNGDLYRLKFIAPTETQEVAQTPILGLTNDTQEGETDSLPSSVLSTITGSQIDQVSGIESATTIETGSTIIRDYKPLEIEVGEDPDTHMPPN